jgi:cytochrome c-type biogenesis protein CcmH
MLTMPPAHAVEPDEILSDPAMEARARQISAELRCLVCQNQSIDDSNAPLARDLRLLVRERLKAGDSDRQVKDFIVARYGEFALLNPRFSLHTLLLWLGPPFVLLMTLLALLLYARRTRAFTPTTAPPLSADERTRLRELIGETGAGRRDQE